MLAPPKKSFPTYLPPMLALLTPPFDSDHHLFELKYDGFRSLAAITPTALHLTGRKQSNFTPRFPDLSPLSTLPPGTLLDGEIVHFKNNRPDFQSLLSRDKAWSGARTATRPSLQQRAPVHYVAFDLLYLRYKPLLHLPLEERRALLTKLLAKHPTPQLLLSHAQVGHGLELFAQTTAQKLEGVIAKRLDSPYEPGQRSGAWSKFKHRQSLLCAIIGYLPNSTAGLKSLILAAQINNELRFVGLVGTGIPQPTHRLLLSLFPKLSQPHPTLPLHIPHARWLKPQLFANVSFSEWTNDQKLRTPVFESLVQSPTT